MLMMLFFQAISVLLILTSTYFLLWRSDFESAFLTVVLGSIAFFLSIKLEIKRKTRER